MGDIEVLDPPNIVSDALFVSDFHIPVDIFHLKHVMEDEGINPIVQNLEADFYELI